ncbi:MAG: hypothetical protein ACKVZH_06780 [Blastocatellia bacterium]
MNCCSGCQQGWGCDGLGDLPPVSSYVVAGSVIAWGGFVRDSVGNSLWDDRIQGLVKNALWQTGGFSWVDAGKVSGFLNHYISIKVTTKVDFAKLSDVFSVIEGAVYQAGFRPEAENFWVESVPAAAANNPDVAQPGAGGGRNTGNEPSGGGFPSISLPNLPDIFGGSNSPSNSGNPIDRLADFLGIGATQAAIIGAVAVVAGILIVKKAL